MLYNLNSRDHKNLAILKLFLYGTLQEEEAMEMLILKQKTQTKRNKYIKKLYRIIKLMEAENDRGNPSQTQI